MARYTLSQSEIWQYMREHTSMMYYTSWMYEKMVAGGVPVELSEEGKKKFVQPLLEEDIKAREPFFYTRTINGDMLFEWGDVTPQTEREE